jgi:hypothetical protein
MAEAPWPVRILALPPASGGTTAFPRELRVTVVVKVDEAIEGEEGAASGRARGR